MNSCMLMATPDLILAFVFGIIALAGLAATILCLRKAMKVSGQRNGDLKMFFWAAGALASLVVSGMSVGYILLPILLGR